MLVLLCVYPAAVYLAARLHDNRYPPTVTDSISFNAKLKFLREHPRLFDSRTVVVGSSMGLNNLDTAHLERLLPGQGPFVNLGAWGLQIEESRYLLDFFLEHAPRARNVILVGQVVDFAPSSRPRVFDREQVWSYLRGEESPWFSVRHFDALKAFKNWRGYDRLHLDNARYEGLLFDSTGAALLDIPAAGLNPPRWTSYGLAPTVSPEALGELGVLGASLRERGLRFVVMVPPVRRAYLEHRESLQTYEGFKSRAREIAALNGAGFVDADRGLSLPDDCFIDTMHLNRQGARRVAEFLAPLL